MTGFEAYYVSTALNNHFFSTYNYIKYLGKSSLKPETYDRKTYKERFMYDKLGNKFKSLFDLENFLVANILLSVSRPWIGDLISFEADENYSQWISRTQSLSYVVQEDIKWLLVDVQHLLSHGEKFNDLFRSIERQHPRIVIALLQGEICIETFIVLDQCVGFFKKINRSMDGDPIWIQVRTKCEKYLPFLLRLKINIPKLKIAIRELIETTEMSPKHAHQAA